MSRIDELIAQYCPDGVPHQGLLEVCDYVRGLTYAKNQELESGPLKVLRSNNIDVQQNVLDLSDVRCLVEDVRTKDEHYLRRDDILMSAASGSRAHVGKVAFIFEDIDFVFGGFMAVLRVKSQVLPRFLFHVITSSRFSIFLDKAITSTTINNLSGKLLSDFDLPVPPIEVQREIVDILDKFTQLEAELEAELEARRKQYEHYRNELLSFKNIQGIHWVTMGEIGEIIPGLSGKTKNDFSSGNAPYLSYKNTFGNIELPKIVDDFVCIGMNERQNELRFGDVVFTGSSETQDELGMSCVVTHTPEIPTYLNSFCFIWRPEGSLLNPEFAKHLFRSRFIRDQIIKTGNGVTRINISKKKLLEVQIPVPEIDVQSELGELLDRFESLTNSISIGLPGEINSRRQQYEYYRDKLLTFKELDVA